MPIPSSSHLETSVSSHAWQRDLLVLLGFSFALAITAGLIKTPMRLPGHSALLWLLVLLLAGYKRRPGMAVGTAALGGGVAGFTHALEDPQAALLG